MPYRSPVCLASALVELTSVQVSLYHTLLGETTGRLPFLILYSRQTANGMRRSTIHPACGSFPSRLARDSDEDPGRGGGVSRFYRRSWRESEWVERGHIEQRKILFVAGGHLQTTHAGGGGDHGIFEEMAGLSLHQPGQLPEAGPVH